MIMRNLLALFVVAAIAGCRGPAVSVNQATTKPARAEVSRTFRMTYTATIADVPASVKRMDLWLPVASCSGGQMAYDIEVETNLPHAFENEKTYGGRLLHVWSDKPGPAQVSVTFQAKRFEYHGWSTPGSMDAPDARFLEPDKLGIIDDRIRKIAAEVTAGHDDVEGKARAIYDYVIQHMAYDKTTPGWGRGDTARACEVGKGNCTDFHSLFISLARASNIPAKFEIGASLPSDKTEGPIEGYHCWAEYWDPAHGWVPVDASEAWKHPEKREYFFGTLDIHRIQFSRGRDLTFVGMRGEPVNFLINPYLELDGVPSADVKKTLEFRDEKRS